MAIVGHSTPECVCLFNERAVAFYDDALHSFGKLPMQSINLTCGGYGNAMNDLRKNYTRRIIRVQSNVHCSYIISKFSLDWFYKNIFLCDCKSVSYNRERIFFYIYLQLLFRTKLIYARIKIKIGGSVYHVTVMNGMKMERLSQSAVTIRSKTCTRYIIFIYFRVIEYTHHTRENYILLLVDNAKI